MRLKTVGIAVVCMMLCVSWACAADTDTSVRYPVMMGCSKVAVELGATKVIVGDSICVVLEENPSTGYTWEYTEEPEGRLELTETRVFEGEESEPKMVGAPVTRVWKFTAVKEGEVTLRYIYRRPWETDVEPVDAVEYKINIGR